MPVIQFVNANSAVNMNTDFVFIADGAVPITVILPLCSSLPTGKVIVIKRSEGDLGGSGNANFLVFTSGGDIIRNHGTPGCCITVLVGSTPDQGKLSLVTDGVSTWYAW
jgi:hypothetical protein